MVFTEAPTVFPSTGRPRSIDYSMVSDTLAPFFDGIRVFEEAATAPHRAVVVTFKSRSEPLLQWVLRAPKRFPREKPVGCARHPIAPAEGFTKSVTDATTEEAAKAALKEAWSDLALAVESELCGVTDRYTGDGPDYKWCGRGMRQDSSRPRCCQQGQWGSGVG